MKIGNYAIPDLRLFPKIHNDIKLIYENHQCSEVENQNAVALLLGHKSANSGSWYSKLADMRLYGLLEARKIKVTPLAEKLTYGTDEEKQQALEQSILNVPLWKRLFDDFGKSLTNGNFWAKLQKITGVSPLEAQKHADFVRNAYLNDIKNIQIIEKQVSKEFEDFVNMESEKADKTKIIIQVGEYSQKLPYSIEGIELAKGFLDILGKQLTNQENSKNT